MVVQVETDLLLELVTVFVVKEKTSLVVGVEVVLVVILKIILVVQNGNSFCCLVVASKTPFDKQFFLSCRLGKPFCG